MIRSDSREQGFALAATILALVLVGALVTGGFFAASQEQRMGMSKQFSSEAFYYAERGLQDALGAYTRGFLQAQMPAPRDTWYAGKTTITSGGQPVGEYELNFTRLDAQLYFIEAKGTVVEGGRYAGATHSLGVVARSMNVDVPMNGALQVYGGVWIYGHALVDGNDWYPADWSDCSSIGAVAGIVMKDQSTLKGPQGAARIEGDPPVEEDPTLDEASFLKFGDVDFDELKAYADHVFPHGAKPKPEPRLDSNGNCDYSIKTNWGAPTIPGHACHYYFPIIYAEGDLKLTGGGMGQGILLVEGDLEVAGGVEFFGITIVKGELITNGTGGHLNGVTLVQGGSVLDMNNALVGGNAVVRFSSCAIQRAIANNPLTSRLKPIAQRGWMDITAAGG